MNRAKIRISLLIVFSLVYIYGSWYLSRPLMALALSSLFIFIVK